MLEENVNKEPEAKSAAKNEVAEEANPEGEDNSKPKKRERKKSMRRTKNVRKQR